jgi:hypothetical protein
MAKRAKEDEPVAQSDQTEATSQPPANGDAAPAKKPPRDKAAAFKKVGNQRLAKAVYAMRRLLPLANRAAYTFTDEQALKICTIANDLAKEVQAAFSAKTAAATPPESFF